MQKKPIAEALKEIGRWLVLFLASSLLVGIESQIDLIPDEVRPVVAFLLTIAFRGLDKYKHELGKIKGELTDMGKSFGLLPF